MKKIIIFIISIFLFWNICYAQWESMNNSISFTGIVSLGDKIFSFSNGHGIFSYSVDKNKWTPNNQGLTSLKISSLSIVDNSIYAGTSDSNLFFSSDYGQNWVSKNNGVPKNSIYKIYKIGGHIYTFVKLVLYVLSDDGTAWLPKKNQIKYVVNTLSFFDNIMYAGTNGYGIYTSTDFGDNWAPMQNQLSTSHISWLFFQGNDLYAQAENILYISNDKGITWKMINPATNNIYNISIIFLGDKIIFGTVYQGVYVSSDSGNTWQNTFTGTKNISNRDLCVFNNKIYTGTDGNGIFCSADSGKTWNPVNNGLLNLHIQKVFATKNLIFVTTPRGPFSSADDGKTWIYCTDALPSNNILSFSKNGNRLFAGSEYGISISDDNGDSWKTSNIGLNSLYINKLLSSENDIYAGTSNGIYLSEDNGNNWTEILDTIITKGITNFTYVDGNLFSLGKKLLLSTNKGKNWKIINDSTGYLPKSSLMILGNNIFTAGYGVYVSDDYGSSFQEANKGLLDYMIRGLGVSGNKIFAATSGQGIFVSTDNGNLWKLSNYNLSNLGINTFYNMGKILAVGTWNYGVISMSTDEGEYWRDIPSIVENINLIYISKSYIYAGAGYSGLFKAKLADFGVNDVDEVKENDNFTLSPIPAMDNISIKLSLPKNTPLNVIITNSFGIEVKNETFHDNFNSITINTNELMTGTYFCSIKSGNNFVVKKFMVLR